MIPIEVWAENRFYLVKKYGPLLRWGFGFIFTVGIFIIIYTTHHRNLLLSRIQSLTNESDLRGLLLLNSSYQIEMMNNTLKVWQRQVESLKLKNSQDHLSEIIDFIKEIIPLKFLLQSLLPDIQNLKMADPRDIGRMKIIAIGSRGSRKDFVDLYCLTREVITLESLITIAMEENGGIKYSKLLFLKGLVDFEEADQEGDLALIWDISWEEVKNSLKEEVKEIAEKIQ